MSCDHYTRGSILQNVHQGPKLLVPNDASSLSNEAAILYSHYYKDPSHIYKSEIT